MSRSLAVLGLLKTSSSDAPVVVFQHEARAGRLRHAPITSNGSYNTMACRTRQVGHTAIGVCSSSCPGTTSTGNITLFASNSAVARDSRVAPGIATITCVAP